MFKHRTVVEVMLRYFRDFLNFSSGLTSNSLGTGFVIINHWCALCSHKTRVRGSFTVEWRWIAINGRVIPYDKSVIELICNQSLFTLRFLTFTVRWNTLWCKSVILAIWTIDATTSIGVGSISNNAISSREVLLWGRQTTVQLRIGCARRTWRIRRRKRWHGNNRRWAGVRSGRWRGRTDTHPVEIRYGTNQVNANDAKTLDIQIGWLTYTQKSYMLEWMYTLILSLSFTDLPFEQACWKHIRYLWTDFEYLQFVWADLKDRHQLICVWLIKSIGVKKGAGDDEQPQLKKRTLCSPFSLLPQNTSLVQSVVG